MVFADSLIVCGYNIYADNWFMSACTRHREVSISKLNLDIPSLADDGCEVLKYMLGLILGLRPANERRCYFETVSLMSWAQA